MAGDGGDGGNGGAGGAGGAGAGGWSVGVLAAAGANAVVDAATTIAVAKAGGGCIGPGSVYASGGKSLTTFVLAAGN